MGQLEAGAHQPGQIGVHFHRGQQQLFGVGVGVVVIEAALRLLDVVDAAPHGSFPQGQVVDVLDAVKGHGVKQHQTLQLVLVFLLLGGVIEQVGHQSHTGPQHGHKPHQNQDRDQQAQRLPPPAALQPGVFFRGDIMFCHGFLSPKVLLLTFSIPQGSAECKTLPMVFL